MELVNSTFVFTNLADPVEPSLPLFSFSVRQTNINKINSIKGGSSCSLNQDEEYEHLGYKWRVYRRHDLKQGKGGCRSTGHLQVGATEGARGMSEARAYHQLDLTEGIKESRCTSEDNLE